MQPLREWSLTRVMLTCAGWVVAILLVAACWLFWYFRPTFESTSGGGGIGAVSIGLGDLFLLVPAGPPIGLFLAWLIVRWRR